MILSSTSTGMSFIFEEYNLRMKWFECRLRKWRRGKATSVDQENGFVKS